MSVAGNRFKILLKVLMLYIIVCNVSTVLCLEENSKCDSDPTEETVFYYSEEANYYVRKIQLALKNHIPCVKQTCSCNAELIEQDLLLFNSGITKKMLNDISTRGIKYQIINHHLYRQKECMFPSRCKGVEYFISLLLKELPDTEVIINVRDWPQTNKQYGVVGPIFSFSKTQDNIDILYPTWGFWEGGPAISLYPTGLGRWDKHRQSILKAAKKYPWKNKENKGFFRGSRTSSERDALVLLSRNKPHIADAQYTKNQAWKSSADTLNAEPASEVSLEDHCKYKFLFNFRGVAASFRFKHLFLCKSLVFHVGNDWIEFFYPAMKPWVHYVPVSENANQQELEKLVKFFSKHDTLAKEIALRGFNHIWDHLRMKDVQCYWKKLLRKYSELLKFKVIKDDSLIML